MRTGSENPSNLATSSAYKYRCHNSKAETTHTHTHTHTHSLTHALSENSIVLKTYSLLSVRINIARSFPLPTRPYTYTSNSSRNVPLSCAPRWGFWSNQVERLSYQHVFPCQRDSWLYDRDCVGRHNRDTNTSAGEISNKSAYPRIRSPQKCKTMIQSHNRGDEWKRYTVFVHRSERRTFRRINGKRARVWNETYVFKCCNQSLLNRIVWDVLRKLQRIEYNK
jgi:hypothetical protein